MSRIVLFAVAAACLGACASGPSNPSGPATDSASSEKVCHYETGSRFGSKDRRVCKPVDAG